MKRERSGMQRPAKVLGPQDGEAGDLVTLGVRS
jgi:hypothetical protein